MKITELMAQTRVAPIQWRVIALCFLVVTLDGFDTAVIGYLAPAIRAEWGLTAAGLGKVFGAGLAGLTIGCFICGPLADRIGRKRVLILSSILFSVGSAASALAHSADQLALIRLLTGIGLGGATPSALTLTSEYSITRLRAFLVALTNCGVTLGFAIGGEIVAQTVPIMGWRGVLVMSGLVPLLVVPALMIWLPESMRFLAARGNRASELLGIAQKINPQVQRIDPETDTADKATPVRGLFSREFRASTVLLWGTFFFSLCAFYLLTSWLPLVVKDSGYSLAEAARIGAMLPLGGAIGSVVIGYAMDRISATRLLACTYIVGGLALCTLGLVTHNAAILMLVVFIAGVGTGGSQTGVNAFAASLYPTASRATGVAWAFGVGRIGSILGSGIGDIVIAATANITQAFCLISSTTFIAAGLMYVMGRLRAPDRHRATASPVGQVT